MECTRQKLSPLRTAAVPLFVVIMAACADSDKSQVPTGVLPPAAEVLAGGAVSKVGAEPGHKKGDKAKRYRIKVDHTRKLIDVKTELTTMEIAPPENACPVESCEEEGVSLIYSGEFDVSGETADTTNTGQAWDPAYETMGEEGTRWHCKQAVDGIKFTHYEYAFQIQGDAIFIGLAPNRSWGVVKGRYQLPRGSHLSTDGKAEVLGGVVEGFCYFTWSQWGPFLVEGGFFAATKFIGQWRVLPKDVPGGGISGDAGAGKGDSEAIRVLQNFLDTGNCTEGWVIVIDGERVC